uniref:BEL1-like homeodomain protein 1 n=1 Tax=Steinernema glaseri TaxID=37863 RepID=A0A1I7YZY1_9BILA
MEPHKLDNTFDPDHVRIGVDHHLDHPTNGLQFQSQRPPLVRRMSRSEPHLDIPHFMNANNHVVSAMHHVLSGLFEVDSNMSLNKMIHSREVAGNLSTSSSMNNLHEHFEHSCALSSDCTDTGDKSTSVCRLAYENSREQQVTNQTPAFAAASSGPLRKSSSAVEWKNTGQTQQLPCTSVQQYNQNIGHDQGLTMSVKPDNTVAIPAGGSGPLATAAQKFAQGNPESLTQSISSAGIGSAANDESHKRPGVLGVFGRGFFARPAMRDDQENYRYIMALDR